MVLPDPARALSTPVPVKLMLLAISIAGNRVTLLAALPMPDWLLCRVPLLKEIVPEPSAPALPT